MNKVKLNPNRKETRGDTIINKKHINYASNCKRGKNDEDIFKKLQHLAK